ncbi:hypothetical protein VTN02DRAFT_3882 [Thermoascus thermophilus]
MLFSAVLWTLPRVNHSLAQTGSCGGRRSERCGIRFLILYTISAACRSAAEQAIAEGVFNSAFFRLTYGALSRHEANNHQEPFSCRHRSCMLRTDSSCFRGGVLSTLPNLQELAKEREGNPADPTAS